MPIQLNITLGQAIPSFKNHKRVTRSGGVMTDPKIKARMNALEDAIVFALYSESPTVENETDLECRKRLRTLLCGLSDDSLREVPEFSFSVETVPKGQEGVSILVEEILAHRNHGPPVKPLTNQIHAPDDRASIGFSKTQDQRTADVLSERHGA